MGISYVEKAWKNNLFKEFSKIGINYKLEKKKRIM